MANTSVQDRREHPRIAVSWPVRMWVDEEMIVGRAVDISEQGLCIITAPTDGATVRGTVWFTVWIEGAAAGSKTYTLSVDGNTITSTPTTSNGPVSLAWPTTAADNGARTATVTVSDSASATGRASIRLTVAN